MATLKPLFVFFMFLVSTLLLPLGIYAIISPLNPSPSKISSTNLDPGTYLERYGYMEYARLHLPFGAPYDEILMVAVREFQLNFGLAQTGVVDLETKSKMLVPRCGVTDFRDGFINTMQQRKSKSKSKSNSSSSKYDFFPMRPRWPSLDLTYKYLQDDFPEDAKAEIAAAFEQWSHVSDFLFHQVRKWEMSNIVIGLYSGEHGDGYPFDGPGNVLAHSFRPADGRMHFDADEDWSFDMVDPIPDTVDFFDFKTVAMHEIGHILGMGHSDVDEALMFPSIKPRQIKDFVEDDIEGINDLYDD